MTSSNFELPYSLNINHSIVFQQKLLLLLLLPLHLTVNLCPVVPHTLPQQTVIVLDNPLAVRLMIVVDVPGIPPVSSLAIIDLEVPDANPLRLLGVFRRRAPGLVRPVVVTVIEVLGAMLTMVGFAPAVIAPSP